MDALSVGVTADALNAYQQFVNAFRTRRKAADARILLLVVPYRPPVHQPNKLSRTQSGVVGYGMVPTNPRKM